MSENTSNMQSESVLIVEDDPRIADLVEETISSLGINVEVAIDGERGLELALEGNHSLIILDLGLPRLDGLQVCRGLRQQNQAVPVLMLTARDTEVDKVLGLEVGATDYLVKPFSMRELLARVQAMLRLVSAVRQQGNAVMSKEAEIVHGPLSIDAVHKKVIIEGKEVELTAKEFELLYLLASHPGRPFSRTELLNQIWGYSCEQYEGTVVSTVYRLRQKIEKDLATPQFIQTRRGMGYTFVSQTEE